VNNMIKLSLGILVVLILGMCPMPSFHSSPTAGVAGARKARSKQELDAQTYVTITGIVGGQSPCSGRELCLSAVPIRLSSIYN